MAPPTVPIHERFGAKYRVDASTGCWIWTASIRTNGYSQFRYSKGKNGYGHVFAYEHFIGPVPTGMHLHHVCEQRACVNPEHLEVVTPQEHVMRNDTPARRNSEKTHCKRGHELSGDNVQVYRGHRRCQTCYEEWRREHHESLLERNRQHYRENRDRRLAYQRRYYEEHKGTAKPPPPHG